VFSDSVGHCLSLSPYAACHRLLLLSAYAQQRAQVLGAFFTSDDSSTGYRPRSCVVRLLGRSAMLREFICVALFVCFKQRKFFDRLRLNLTVC
jgi:hypothetical protein